MLQERFLRMPDVARKIGFKPSKIYMMIQEKQFPAQIKIGRTALWLETEVTVWMSERINAARSQPLRSD